MLHTHHTPFRHRPCSPRTRRVYGPSNRQRRAAVCPCKGDETGRGLFICHLRYVSPWQSALYKAQPKYYTDVLTGARLASAGYTIEKAKKRRLQLHGPDEDVPFDFTGKMWVECRFTDQKSQFGVNSRADSLGQQLCKAFAHMHYESCANPKKEWSFIFEGYVTEYILTNSCISITDRGKRSPLQQQVSMAPRDIRERLYLHNGPQARPTCWNMPVSYIPTVLPHPHFLNWLLTFFLFLFLFFRAREGDKKEPAKIQILHYNIDRFPNEIKDLRGLETLLVARYVSLLPIEYKPASIPSQRPRSLLCLLDASEDRSTTLSSKLSKSAPSPSPPSLPSTDSPIIPLQPQPERVISEEDFEPVRFMSSKMAMGVQCWRKKRWLFKENPNEIIVGKNTNIDDHIARAVGLLEVSPSLVLFYYYFLFASTGIIWLNNCVVGSRNAFHCYPYTIARSASTCIRRLPRCQAVCPMSSLFPSPHLTSSHLITHDMLILALQLPTSWKLVWSASIYYRRYTPFPT